MSFGRNLLNFSSFLSLSINFFYFSFSLAKRWYIQLYSQSIQFLSIEGTCYFVPSWDLYCSLSSKLPSGHDYIIPHSALMLNTFSSNTAFINCTRSNSILRSKQWRRLTSDKLRWSSSLQNSLCADMAMSVWSLSPWLRGVYRLAMARSLRVQR
jgi:hypothetical protein